MCIVHIFLSYGRDHYTSIAERIKSDLEAQGNEVWFDVECLKPGCDWERYIEAGLDRVSAVPGEGRFLLLMTPHSVRRPDGYCINELARAFGRNLPIIPVMVSDVEPPLSICRLQWLDMRACFPVEKHEVQYKKQFEQLVKALDRKQVPFEGVQQKLLNYLQPISCDDDLSRHLLRFTGREWVMTEVERWLASSSSVLWVTGEAGVGKSAIAAWLCERRPEIAAYHCCRFGNSERVDPRKVLFSLAYQLSTQLPVYQDRLNASPLDKTTAESNLRAVFDRLFVNLLNDPVPIADKPQVMLIDALDEATRNGKNELAALISNEFNRLPNWLRLIVTSRPHEEEINFSLQALDPWKLEAQRPENLEDIRTYLRRELRAFTGNNTPSDEFVTAIIEKSEGLFLYVSWVREEVLRGRLSLDHIEQFPQGLGGIFADFFQRYFPDPRQYASDCRPALEAICAVREPLERRDLASLLGWSEYEMRSLTARLGSLFPEVDGRLHPFHQSVRDWLTDPRRSGPYFVDVSAQEKRLADFAWQEYNNGVETMGHYCIKHAPAHLAACQRNAELRQLLLDFAWMEAKLRAAGIAGLLADYDLALDLFSPGLRKEADESPADIAIGVPPRRTMESPSNVADHAGTIDSDTNALRMVQDALRLSAHVLARDAAQLPGQFWGRLGSETDTKIRGLLDQCRVCTHAWLRPLRPTLVSPGGPLLRTLDGHSLSVTALALTANGKHVVSGSADDSLKVWDLETGKEMRTLTGHTGGITAVALSPDGTRMISGSDDQTLRIWNLETGKQLRTMLTGETDAVSGVAVVQNGERAVSCSRGGTLKVWDFDTGALLHTQEAPSSGIADLMTTPDGKPVISFCVEGYLTLWVMSTGQELKTAMGGRSIGTVFALFPDLQTAVLGSLDGSLTILNISTGETLCSFVGHSLPVSAVAVTGDGRQLVSGSWDKTIKLWDLDVALRSRAPTRDSLPISALVTVPDGKHVVSASYRGPIKIYDSTTGEELYALTGHSDSVLALAASHDGNLVVSGSKDKTVKIWDLRKRDELRTLTGHSEPVEAVAVTSNSMLVVSGSEDGTVKIWDLETGEHLRTLTGHSEAVKVLVIMPDDNHVISGSWDYTLRLWNLSTGNEVCSISEITSDLALTLTRDGTHLICGSQDGGGFLKVWNLVTGDVRHIFPNHKSRITAVAVSPDGEQVFSGCLEGMLVLSELTTGKILHTVAAHSNAIQELVVIDRGNRLISVSYDKTVKLWDLETWQSLCFTAEAEFGKCCVGSDGETIVVGDYSGTLHFLRVESPRREQDHPSNS